MLHKISIIEHCQFLEESIYAAAAKGNINGELFTEFIELNLDDDLSNWLVLNWQIPSNHSLFVKKYIEKVRKISRLFQHILRSEHQSRNTFDCLRRLCFIKLIRKWIYRLSDLNKSDLKINEFYIKCLNSKHMESLFYELLSWVDHICDFILYYFDKATNTNDWVLFPLLNLIDEVFINPTFQKLYLKYSFN